MFFFHASFAVDQNSNAFCGDQASMVLQNNSIKLTKTKITNSFFSGLTYDKNDEIKVVWSFTSVFTVQLTLEKFSK